MAEESALSAKKSYMYVLFVFVVFVSLCLCVQNRLHFPFYFQFFFFEKDSLSLVKTVPIREMIEWRHVQILNLKNNIAPFSVPQKTDA